MSTPQNEDATWDDMDWGEVDLDPEPLPPTGRPAERTKPVSSKRTPQEDPAPAQASSKPAPHAGPIVVPPTSHPAAPAAPSKPVEPTPPSQSPTVAATDAGLTEPAAPPRSESVSVADSSPVESAPPAAAAPVSKSPVLAPVEDAPATPSVPAVPSGSTTERLSAAADSAIVRDRTESTATVRLVDDTEPVEPSTSTPASPAPNDDSAATDSHGPATTPGVPPASAAGDATPAGQTDVPGRVIAVATKGTLTFSADSIAEAPVAEVRDGATLGRKRENDIVVKDLHVSGHHARFASCGSSGALEVIDLDSSGGTFVNDTPVARKPLANGDRITFGTVEAVFRYVAGAQLGDDMEFAGTLVHGKAELAQQLAGSMPAQRKGMLVVLTGDDHNARAYATDDEPVTVGRAPDNVLLLSDPHVSNYHARLTCSMGMIFELEDLGSSCGTTVDGEEVGKVRLHSGAIIHFGPVECLFRIMAINSDGSMKEYQEGDDDAPPAAAPSTGAGSESPSTAEPEAGGLPLPTPVPVPTPPPPRNPGAPR